MVYLKYKAIIFLCAIFFVIFGSYVVYNQFINVPLIETKTEIDARMLEASVRQIAELSTLGFYYSKVGEFSEQSTLKLFGGEIGIPGTKKSFLIVYDGEMKLGIDANAIKIDVRDNTIFITLPETKVLSHVVHEDSVRVYDESSGIFTSMSVSDYTNFIAVQKKEKEDSLDESNLLGQAKTNAQNAILNLLHIFPGVAGEYTIQFK